MKINFDVDIDMRDRDEFLSTIPHIVGSIEKDGVYTKHNTGVYFQNIPVFPLENFSAIDHKAAEEAGYFKVDFLNNSVYDNIESMDHLDQLLNTEPMWELLEHKEVVEQLYHISNYADLVKQYKPTSIMQLAYLLAIIRPAKKHLQGKDWQEISETVWDKPSDGSYYFKKAHAVAFATAIVVQLNRICEG